jgi:hypothetical protein
MRLPEVDVDEMAFGVHRSMVGQLTPLAAAFTFVPWREVPARSLGAAIRFMFLLPRTSFAFCASGLVPMVCCWVNHGAAGSRVPMVFHSSSEVLGQEKTGILGNKLDLRR